MAKNKININPFMPSDEQISRHQDFDKLLKKFPGNPGEGNNGHVRGQSSGGFNMVRLISIVATVAVVVTGIFFFLKRTNKGKVAETAPVTEAAALPPLVQPPFEGLNVPYQTYAVNPSQAQVLEYPSGTKLRIPENAFLDSSGNLVTGEVELRYREMHDPVDILVSGIPMNYDTSAGDYYLESAGMCEILAFQNNKPLFANPEAVIQIEMASYRKGDDYNLYYLDEKDERRWVQKGKASYEELPEPDETRLDGFFEEQNFEEQIKDTIVMKYPSDTSTISIAPIKPVQENPAKRSFTLDIDPKDYPEMARFSNMKWQYTGTSDSLDPVKNPWVFKEIWTDVWIERSSDRNYRLNFSKPDKKFQTVVTPVFAPEDMKEAMKTYTKEFAAYQRATLNKQDRIYRDQAKMQQVTAGIKPPASTNVFLNPAPPLAIRSFGALRFGSWNCDSPIPRPRGASMSANFLSSDLSNLSRNGYLIDVEKNTVFNIFEGNSFTFNPNSASFSVTANEEGYLALFTPKDFQELKKDMSGQNPKMDIVFEVNDQKQNDISDLRKLLEESL